MMVPVAARPKT